MTSLIITWSGLIFPLLGFVAMIAWRFPKSYERLVGPVFLFLIWSAFLATAAWNLGLGKAESTIEGIDEIVAKKITSYSAPNAPYIPYDDKGFEEKTKKYQDQLLAWEKEYSEWQGANNAVTKAQDTIDSNQLEYYDFYWFLGLFYFAILLSNIKGWFEKMEKKLSQGENRSEPEVEENNERDKD